MTATRLRAYCASITREAIAQAQRHATRAVDSIRLRQPARQRKEGAV